jgi:hypothetical protein
MQAIQIFKVLSKSWLQVTHIEILGSDLRFGK